MPPGTPSRVVPYTNSCPTGITQWASSLVIALQDAGLHSSKGISSMGYIVYNTASGRAERYYKAERTARAQATRLNNNPHRLRYEAGDYRVLPYAAYEGVLMGLKGDMLTYWSWLNTANR